MGSSIRKSTSVLICLDLSYLLDHINKPCHKLCQYDPFDSYSVVMDPSSVLMQVVGLQVEICVMTKSLSWIKMD